MFTSLPSSFGCFRNRKGEENDKARYGQRLNCVHSYLPLSTVLRDHSFSIVILVQNYYIYLFFMGLGADMI